jgi:hypothetical protein
MPRVTLQRSILLVSLLEGYAVGTPRPREPRTRVRRDPAQQEYDPESHYISVQLGDRSKQRLLKHIQRQFPDAGHPNVQGNHVTLVAQPTADDIERIRKHVGKQVTFHATHHASGPSGVQAVRVRGLSKYSDKPHKHVTVSTGQGVPAKASNDLLVSTKGDRLGKHIPLTGRIEITPRLGQV